MKNIKVFIASSSELDEDKLQADLYFAKKNKIYHKRNIFFEHKTWKDFPSNLTQEHLQEKYNQYIRECDIVIFLFDTKIGQYTEEELRVAFEETKKSNGKKPKVYIYAKNGDLKNTLTEKIKIYSEKKYGHFCDIYSDYKDLSMHFDYQLELLENEGVIHPDPVDLKRTARFVLWGVLPTLLAIFAILIYQFNQVGMLKVSLTEAVHNQLPFRGGSLTLQYAGRTETKEVKSLGETIVFDAIPKRQCWFGDFTLLFEAKGYLPADTTIDYTEQISMPVTQNGEAGLIRGQVTDDDRKPVGNASVSVLGHTVTTGTDGSFELHIPLDKQAISYRMTVVKEGYQVWDYEGVAPSPKDIMRIVVHK